MDLQSAFYIAGIVYVILNIILLIGVGVGIFFIFRAFRNLRRKCEEKMKYVDRIMHHPEDVVAEIGASLVRKGVQNMKGIFKRKNTGST